MTSSAELTDEELVVAVRERDQELFSEIIRRYQTKLTHYLRKFIGVPDELEDVLQEVFIKVYRNLYGFNAGRRFSPWIYRIAHNEAVNHIAKNKNAVSLDDQEWEIIDEAVDIKADVDRGLLKRVLEDGLQKMNNKYREPLILYFFEEKSYEEISDILHIPSSTVGVLIMRAKAQLKQIVQQKIYGRKK